MKVLQLSKYKVTQFTEQVATSKAELVGPSPEETVAARLAA